MMLPGFTFNRLPWVIALLLSLCLMNVARSQTISLREDPDWNNDQHWSGSAPGYDMTQSAILTQNSTVFEAIIINDGDTLVINPGVLLITYERITIKDGGTLIINGKIVGLNNTKRFKVESGSLVAGNDGLMGWSGDWKSTSPPASISINGYFEIDGDFENSVSIDGSGGIDVGGNTTNNPGGSIFGCLDAGGTCCPMGICGDQTSIWVGNGDGVSWSDPTNWSLNSVPTINDRIVIDCACTVRVINDVKIDGSLVLYPTATLDLQNWELKIGDGNNDAELINHGNIINGDEIKVKGNGSAGSGPFITNTGTMSSGEFHVGNNNGGGKLTNTNSGVINVTDLTGDAMHVDGTICNEGIIDVTGTILLHGAVVTCGGIINAGLIKLEDNPKNGGGASGGGSEILSQAFSDGQGCSGTISSSLIYKVPGGVNNGPNGDDTYTFQELMEEFGPTDDNPQPQFSLDPDLVTSCGAIFDITPPTITNFPDDTTVYSTASSCEVQVNWEDPTVEDESGLESVTSSHNSGENFPAGLTTVSFTATDSAGNTNEKSFRIIVLDTIPPTLSGFPANIDQAADADQCGTLVTWIAPLAADNCSIESNVSTHNPGDFFSIGTTTVTYTLTDSSGNVNSQSFDVTISDNIDPIITGIPQDIVQNNDTGECGAIIHWDNVEVSDNCSVSSFEATHNSGDFFPIGTTTVTYTAIDSSDNAHSQSFNITIADNSAPEIINMPTDITQNADLAKDGAIVNWIVPIANDNCGVDSLYSDYQPGGFFPIGKTNVSYVASDSTGNIEERTFSITVIDTQNPEIQNMPENMEQYVIAGECGMNVSWILPTATDNWGVRSIASNFAPGDYFKIGTTTVTYTATDSADNYIEQSFDITVIDTVSPVINNMPLDIVQSSSSDQCGAYVDWVAPIASDNCGIISLTSDYAPGEFFQIGSTTVSYTAIDSSQNSVTKSFEIAIEDNIKPELHNIPEEIVQNVDTDKSVATVNWTVPFGTDNCSLDSLTCSHDPGNEFPVGTTTVTYTAFDAAGNSTVQAFNIKIDDNIDPVITSIPEDITFTASSGACDATVSWTPPDASDNCGISSFTSSHEPGDIFPVGITFVTYEAIDVNGNSASDSLMITIKDDEAPEFIFCPSNFEVLSMDTVNGTAVVSWELPIVSDKCGEARLESEYTPGQEFAFGNHNIIYTAIDAGGNKSFCTLDVPVIYNRCPEVNQFEFLSVMQEEALFVTIDAFDPDGDQVTISDISHRQDQSMISNIDSVNLTFDYASTRNFHGKDTLRITLSDNGTPQRHIILTLIIEVEREMIVNVSSAITLNDDMINDYWHLENIDLFPQNTVYIYDRWGGLVYQTSGYNNNSIKWRGQHNQVGSGESNVVDKGTYFYVIDPGNGMSKISGALEVVR